MHVQYCKTSFEIVPASCTQDLVSAVLAVMGVSEKNIGENGSLSQLGIDSMQVVEVRAILQRELGRPFPLDQVS